MQAAGSSVSETSTGAGEDCRQRQASRLVAVETAITTFLQRQESDGLSVKGTPCLAQSVDGTSTNLSISNRTEGETSSANTMQVSKPTHVIPLSKPTKNDLMGVTGDSLVDNEEPVESAKLSKKAAKKQKKAAKKLAKKAMKAEKKAAKKAKREAEQIEGGDAVERDVADEEKQEEEENKKVEKIPWSLRRDRSNSTHESDLDSHVTGTWRARDPKIRDDVWGDATSMKGWTTSFRTNNTSMSNSSSMGFDSIFQPSEKDQQLDKGQRIGRGFQASTIEEETTPTTAPLDASHHSSTNHSSTMSASAQSGRSGERKSYDHDGIVERDEEGDNETWFGPAHLDDEESTTRLDRSFEHHKSTASSSISRPDFSRRSSASRSPPPSFRLEFGLKSMHSRGSSASVTAKSRDSSMSMMGGSVATSLAPLHDPELIRIREEEQVDSDDDERKLPPSEIRVEESSEGTPPPPPPSSSPKRPPRKVGRKLSPQLPSPGRPSRGVPPATIGRNPPPQPYPIGTPRGVPPATIGSGPRPPSPQSTASSASKKKSPPPDELLFNYLKSTGRDSESAMRIVRDFAATREGSAVMDSAERMGDIDALQRQQQADAAPRTRCRNETSSMKRARMVFSMVSFRDGNRRSRRSGLDSSSLSESVSERNSRAAAAFGGRSVESSRSASTGSTSAAQRVARAMSFGNLGVVEAKVVEEREQLPVVQGDAAPLTTADILKERPIRRLVAIGVIIGVIVVGVVCHVVFGRGGGSAAPESASLTPSSSPTLIDDSVLNAAIVISGEEPVLYASNSPQFQTVGWLSTFDKYGADDYGESFTQRYVITLFYFSTGGQDYSDKEKWLDPTVHECEWSEGILCSVDATQRRTVTGLSLTRNRVGGTLPTELAKLKALEFLELPDNEIGGRLPWSIFHLSRLSSLNLNNNQITGPLPMSIGNGTDLEQLWLSSNQINSTIPVGVQALTNLRSLDLSQNDISGTIDTVFGPDTPLNSLKFIDVRHNRLGGSLPRVPFENIRRLDITRMDFNRFTGAIPEFKVESLMTREFTVSNNLLTGTLPDVAGSYFELQAFPNRVQKLDFSFNNLTGTIPALYAFMGNLTHIDFSANSFSGTFPSPRLDGAVWKSIQYIGAADNELTGSVPRFFTSNLKHANFEGNRLTGGIPSEVGANWTNLEILKLNDNNLTGGLNENLGNLERLRDLEIRGNNLNGTIPNSFVNLKKLEIIDLAWNQIRGTISSSLGSLSILKKLHLEENQLTGTIPKELGNLRLLQVLRLEINNLQGSIPPQLSNLGSLTDLNVTRNQLEGTLPGGICTLFPGGLSFTAVGCTVECYCCTGHSEDCEGGRTLRWEARGSTGSQGGDNVILRKGPHDRAGYRQDKEFA